ncbi:anti-sigma factor [Streptomyces phaeoluteigriseus]|uniref:Regulator of SigK n=1 Tax=Streptomyces phaeoluteigriseus TaxID=114686 RepID=A0ABY4Z8F9_9ACTN|nr:anti-sigma factor [Streptomyces phaeoluteigriseus]USQ85256.1 anti-sigma factor [Streptomyces phaeoluteigriseus]
MTTTDPHRMTGAYALYALPAEEREDFERHLEDCAPCAEETAELSATAARLGLAMFATPRPALREQVLHRVTTVRQEGPGGPVPARSGGAARRMRMVSRWALAACVAAAAGLGGATVWQHERAEDAREQARLAERGADEIAAVLTAPDARSSTVRLTAGATGTVVVSDSRDRAVFVASGMDRPPSGKVYQLWFDDGGTMRSAGVMDPHRTDQAVVMAGAVDGASGMGITLEPEGGSPRPTSDPLTVVPFTA